VAGPDGNLWFNDRGSKSIGKVSLQIPPTAATGAASAITNTTATVSATVNPLGSPTTVAFQYGTSPAALGLTAAAGTIAAAGDPSTRTAALSGLPPGTVIYYRVAADNGFGGTVTGAVLTFKTTGSPTAPQLTTATVGNQQIQLTTPSTKTCTAKSKTLSVTLRSVTNPKSHAAKLRFSSAAFYIDRGVKHTRKTTIRLHNGRKKTVTVATYKANAAARKLPANVRLRLTGLKSGTHTLKVTVTYKRTVTTHHHRKTVAVTKTVTAKFKVC
jgi:hypothetical protein